MTSENLQKKNYVTGIHFFANTWGGRRVGEDVQLGEPLPNKMRVVGDKTDGSYKGGCM
jgi:hypothetical protein